MGIGVRFGLGPVSIGAGFSFRSRRRHRPNSDSGEAEAIGALLVAAFLLVLVAGMVIGAIGALIGFLYAGCRPQGSFATVSAYLFFGFGLLLFVGGLGIDVVAVRYFLKVGSSQLTPTQVVLAGVGVGLLLLGAIVAVIWLLRTISASQAGVGWRLWIWLLSALATWIAPVVVLGRWMSLQENDVEVFGQFAIVFLLILGFISAIVVTRISDVEDGHRDASFEVNFESSDLVPPNASGPLARIVAAGHRHTSLVQLGTPAFSAGISLLVANLLELFPSN